jgi:hypothetical protein
LPARCPVLDIMAIANADNAWKYFESSEDIYRYRFPNGVNSLHVLFKDKWLKAPLLRRVEHTPNGIKLSDTLAWRYQELYKILHIIGMLIGFLHVLTAYCLRRGSANILHSMSSSIDKTSLTPYSDSFRSRIMQATWP